MIEPEALYSRFTHLAAGLFSGFECAGADGRQLRLEHSHASAGGRQQLKAGLQCRTQSRLCLHHLTEHLRQTRQQILHQL